MRGEDGRCGRAVCSVLSFRHSGRSAAKTRNPAACASRKLSRTQAANIVREQIAFGAALFRVFGASAPSPGMTKEMRHASASSRGFTAEGLERGTERGRIVRNRCGPLLSRYGDRDVIFDVGSRSVTVGSRKRIGRWVPSPGPWGQPCRPRLGQTRFTLHRSSACDGRGATRPPGPSGLASEAGPARPFPAAASGLVPRGASPATGTPRHIAQAGRDERKSPEPDVRSGRVAGN